MLPTTIPHRRGDGLYWSFTWLCLALHLGHFFTWPETAGLWLYTLLLIGSYALLWVLPAWVLSRLFAPLSRRLEIVLQVGLAALLQLVIYADSLIWDLYGFHLNGFVWNILTTPGGISALGSSESSYFGFALIALAWLGGHALLRLLASLVGRSHGRSRWTWVVAAFLLATSAERIAYGLSHFYGYSPLLETAQRMPFYQPLTMRRLLEHRLGLERPQRLETEDISAKGQLAYPQAALDISPPANPLNIVWLVAESWRADSLTARVMPRTYAFAEQNERYLKHFSAGNGTRIGMFSQFYSLPPNLWFPVLDARIGSPLIEVLQQQAYQLKLFTSARFSYPEFDKTLFVKVPPEQRQEYDQGESWQRDRKNVTDLLSFIEQRDPARPFMTFMFFESPHANYNFPEESVIEPDYLKDFSYANMDLQRDIGGIHKRYINAVHHLDSQIARVTDYLSEQGLLENTLVVITGDHGEEFMEKGRWGHNSTFVDEQLRVPLVIHLPGRQAAVHQHRTSHVDLLPSLMPLLGVRNPSSDYSIGQVLWQSDAERTLIAGDWDRLAFLGPRYKVVLPFSSGSFTPIQVSGADDQPASEQLLQELMPSIQKQLQDYRRFLSH